jgi:hypothetical protein
MREISAIMGSRSIEVQRMIDKRTEWIARAVTAGATIDMTANQVAQRPDDTAIIDAAAKRYVETTSGQSQHDLVTTYRVFWRTHSGTAHGLRWPALYRTEILGRFVRGGASGRLTAGGFPALSMSASAVALLTMRAIELYEERRQPA